MSNEVAVKQTNEVAVADDYKQIATQWLESTGNLQKFTNQEKAQFIDICCAFGLNPIKREVYGIKFGNTFNIVVGYETYIKRAQKTGLLDGFNTTTVKINDKETKAVCTIYRKDWKYPFVHEVFLSEYHQHNKMWNEKPITMLKKVAEAQAFRKCFTEDLGGLPYTDDELPTEEKQLKDVTPIEEPAPIPVYTNAPVQNECEPVNYEPVAPVQSTPVQNAQTGTNAMIELVNLKTQYKNYLTAPVLSQIEAGIKSGDENEIIALIGRTKSYLARKNINVA